MDPIIVGLAGKAMTILMPYAAKTAGEFINVAGHPHGRAAGDGGMRGLNSVARRPAYLS